jgi:DNA-binding CsgD family transcriptional regulator
MLQASCSLNFALQLSGRITASLDTMERSLALAREQGHAYRIAYLLAQQGYAFGLLGRIPEARAALADAVASNSAYLDTLLPDFAATIHWLAGDLRDAVAAMRQSVTMGVTELSQRRMLGASVAAVAAVELGDTEQVDYWHQLLRATKRGDWWAQSDQVTWAVGIREWGRGDLPAATLHLTAAARRMMETGAVANARLTLFDLAELVLETSDLPTATAVGEWLDDLNTADEADGPPLQALDTATRAATALRAGTPVDLDALDHATAELARCGWKLHHARALVIAGRARIGSDNEAAVENITDAAAGFEACAAAWRRHASLELLDRLGPRGKRVRTATSGPGALTSRELEVVRLAVEGLATREIGERLFIGRRTVETHLTNSYAKLGVRSRVELVRIADQFAEPATP